MSPVPGTRWRVRLACSVRLRCLQACLVLALCLAVWLVVAPRWGRSAAVLVTVLTATGLVWRAGLDSRRRPDGLMLYPDGLLERLDGTAPWRSGRPLGLLQWPGMLALTVRYDDGGAETVLALSDALDAEAFRGLAAWARRHTRSHAVS